MEQVLEFLQQLSLDHHVALLYLHNHSCFVPIQFIPSTEHIVYNVHFIYFSAHNDHFS